MTVGSWVSVPGTPHWRPPSRGRPGSLFLITQVKGLIYKILCQLKFLHFLSYARAIKYLYSLSMLLLLITYDRELRLPIAFTMHKRFRLPRNAHKTRESLLMTEVLSMNYRNPLAFKWHLGKNTKPWVYCIALPKRIYSYFNDRKIQVTYKAIFVDFRIIN